MTPTLRAALLAAFVLGACGCTSHLYDDYTKASLYQAQDGERPFLGVVVTKGTSHDGVEVMHVLKEGPADKAGVRPGDRIVSYGARRIRSSAELQKAVRALGTLLQVDLGVASPRGEREPQLVEVVPVKESDYASTANAGLGHSVSGTHVPFLYNSVYYELSPETWYAYQGYSLPKGVLAYSEVDVLPIFSFSLFRVEDTDLVNDISRVKFLHWPLIFTTSAQEDPDLRDGLRRLEETHERL